MGRSDWVRPCFAMQGNQQHSASSKADQIMAKYRPIAPRPPILTTSSLGKPASSDSTFSALDFLSTFNTTHKSNGGHNRSGYRRRASGCLGIQAHSPRLPKKSRGEPSLGIPSINQDILFSRVEVDGPEVLQAPTTAKELEAMDRREANALDERYGGSDEWVSVKVVIKSIGEVGVENLAPEVDDVSVAEVAETQCGCGSAGFLVFPIVGEEEKNLVTLPLLPESPQLHNVSSASNNASSHEEGRTSANNASSHKEGILLRLFGRDLGHREVGSCQISNNESLKLEKVVPIVGLSFI